MVMMRTMTRLIGSVALACAFASGVMAGQEPGKSRPPVPGKTPPTPDAPFIGAAAMDGLAEVELGRLASQNASSPDVKRFAQRMVDHHSKAGDELKGLASQKDVALATKLDDEHRAVQQKLATLKGAAFDQAYMAHMAAVHLKAVALFQDEAKAGKDAEVKAWAAKLLPTMQEHVKLASALNATINKGGK
jgi:putative membrane protein